jgi:hypothetical protein
MNLDKEILKLRNPSKQDWPSAKAQKQIKQHKDNCMWHSSQRFKERMGHSVGYDEIAILAQLVQGGYSVAIGNDQHLVRYGDDILRLVYCPVIKAVKTILPIRDLAAMMLSRVPRNELHKLVKTKPSKRLSCQ